MQSLTTLGRTTFKTVGVRMYADSSDSMSKISCFDEQAVLDGSPFFPSGSIGGAVVVMLGTDGSPSSSEIVVQSPRGQDDLETIERSIAQLTWVRDELSKTTAAA